MRRNRLLRALSGEDAAALAKHLEPVRLCSYETVREPGEPLRYAYLPEDTLLSLTTVMRDGSAVEFATVGSEGVLANYDAREIVPDSGRVVCQIAGEALRIRSRLFADHVTNMPRLNHLIERYKHYTYAAMAQLVACNRLHSIAERCARSLLVARDSTGRNAFGLTQEILSILLGVRRAGVTIAMKKLRRTGAIEYHRGNVSIVNAKTLEADSCECYRVIHDLRAALR
jgi:CRP-like cAMP-binding protein